VLLIARGHEPFQGQWCLPGGMVDLHETVEAAAMREVREEVGLAVSIVRVVSIRSSPQRDPRGHFVSIVLLAAPTDARPQRTKEATALCWTSHELPGRMAFDHAEILRDHWNETATSLH
jgi:8-oxo-dGTP diphosphatase